MMNVAITGSSGYIGNKISNALQKKGHSVLGIRRSLLYGPIETLTNELKARDVIINLAGAPILQRWSRKNKETIYNSRIQTTQNLVQAINLLDKADYPGKFISASAIGIYKAGEIHDEESKNYGNDFVANVVKDWEESLNSLPASVQCSIFRIGLVVGKEAKTIKNLKLPFQLGLGGKIGSGQQAFPFIHEEDLVNAFVWAIEDLSESKTYNLVAPEQITNQAFSKAFAKQIHRPLLFSIPGFAVKMILGEASVLLLSSPVVSSSQLVKAGFKFTYPTIHSALSDILS